MRINKIRLFLLLMAISLLILTYFLHKSPIPIAHSETPSLAEGFALSGGLLKPEIHAINAPTSPETTKSAIMDMIRQKALQRRLSPKIMSELASCESGFTQFNENGSVLSGRIHPPDKGIFQINIKVWEEASDLTGYDWRTIEGNIDMAMYIAENYGYDEWVCYKP